MGVFRGKWVKGDVVPLLKKENIDIDFVCVVFEKINNPVKELAIENGLDVLEYKDVNSDVFYEIITKFESDLFVSMSFDQIFKERIINLPKYKIINCHSGALPFYRGRNSISWALINDENYFGITVHFVSENIDQGDIIIQRKFSICDSDDFSTLLNIAHIECANVLYEAVKLIQNKSVNAIPQNSIHPFGSYFAIRMKNDEIIDWNMPSRHIFNHIRAFSYPGPIETSFINNQVIKINKSREIPNVTNYIGISGQVVGKKEDSFFVKTQDSVLEIIDFEYEGHIKIGDRLLSHKS